MSGPVELKQYTVRGWILEESPTGVVVTLVLGRKILNEILTTYLPTSLLIIIVHTTNYYKDFFFEAIVTVNLTGEVLLNILHVINIYTLHFTQTFTFFVWGDISFSH